MTVLELMEALEVLLPDSEVFVFDATEAKQITRIEDDSQGVYIVTDQMATDREDW